jgi:hypothetical protein
MARVARWRLVAHPATVIRLFVSRTFSECLFICSYFTLPTARVRVRGGPPSATRHPKHRNPDVAQAVKDDDGRGRIKSWLGFNARPVVLRMRSFFSVADEFEVTDASERGNARPSP